jgi:DNA-binding XRE family transcriptional regulator
MQTATKVTFANLRAEMAREGYTIKDLAEWTDVSTVTIRSKLSGKSKWTLDDACIIANHLDKTISYLFLEG